jgi:hypothetical protein
MQVTIQLILEELLVLGRRSWGKLNLSSLVARSQSINKFAVIGDSDRLDNKVRAINKCHHLTGRVNRKCFTFHVMLVYATEISIAADVKDCVELFGGIVFV